MSRYRPVPITLVALIAIGLLFWPEPGPTLAAALPVMALTVLIIGLMATSAMPEFQISALFFLLGLALQVAPAEAVLSGLYSSAFWLIAGGVIIGIAAEKTGLGSTVAVLFLRRIGASYAGIVAAMAFVCVALAFLVPAAIARMIILMPIAMALADRAGLEPGGKGRNGLALVVTIASFHVSMSIYPSTFPNVLLAGLADSLYGIQVTYGLYQWMHFPVAGMLKTLLLIALTCIFFNDRVEPDSAQWEESAPLSRAGRRLAVVIAITIALWATDFIHGIDPGWVAVAAALICLIPGIGMVTFDDLKAKPGGFVALFGIATVIGLGAVIAATGAGAIVARFLLAAVEFRPGETVYAYGVFSAINILMSLFATLPGTIAVLAPFAGAVAEQSGIPLITVLMIMANGYANVFFPYQAPPVLAGLRLGGVSLADGTRMTFVLSLVSVLSLVPLTYVWWKIIGYMP